MADDADNRAVFFDRDGTIIEEREYLHRVNEVDFIPGAIQALQQLERSGYLLIMVTNQSGVGRGYFSREDVEEVHRYIYETTRSQGVNINDTFVSYDSPNDNSQTRKPSPHFLHEARKKWNLDLAQCYMIGDKQSDLECGWNAGVKKGLLVRTGYGKEFDRDSLTPEQKTMTRIVADFPAAAQWILSEDEQ